MATLRSVVKRIRRAIVGDSLPQLDPRLSGLEQVFRSPPMTTELAAAIKLISPHLDFGTDDKYRAFWEAEQNGACWGEYEALAPIFEAVPKPKRILEIGPGMGRSLVFFSKKLGLEESEINAFDGNGTSTKYTISGPRFEDSFCGNLKMLDHVLKFNGINNVKLFDAQKVPLAKMPGPYDLIYSFYCIGFHWSLDHFLDDLLPLMHDRSIALFTLAPDFKPFPRLESLSYKIVDWKTAWPKEAWLRILVLSKTELPELK